VAEEEPDNPDSKTHTARLLVTCKYQVQSQGYNGFGGVGGVGKDRTGEDILVAKRETLATCEERNSERGIIAYGKNPLVQGVYRQKIGKGAVEDCFQKKLRSQ